ITNKEHLRARLLALLPRDIPDQDGIVTGAAGQRSAVRREQQERRPAAQPLEPLHDPTGRHVPDLDRFVPPRPGAPGPLQPLAVRRQHLTPAEILRTLRTLPFFPGRHVPLDDVCEDRGTSPVSLRHRHQPPSAIAVAESVAQSLVTRYLQPAEQLACARLPQ